MKKFIYFFLAILMTIVLLVSCNKGDNKGQTEETKDNIVSDSSMETEASSEIVEFDISKFKITYNDSNDIHTARDLRAEIAIKIGVTLDVQRIEGEPLENELVIGLPEREISKKIYIDEYDFYYNKAGVYVDKGHIYILGLDKVTKQASIEYLIKNMIKDNKKICVPKQGMVGYEITSSSANLPVRADDSYLRIVSHNILLQSLRSDIQRAQDLKTAFKFYDADIIALQEVDDLWHVNAGLDDIMHFIGYSMVPIKPTAEYAHLEDKDIRNPIYYRTDKFELVDCGYDRYNATEFADTEYPSSSYTWACLKLKENGKQVIVISTHLVARVNHTGAPTGVTDDSYRESSVLQILMEITKLEEKFNAPVITVGDFNNNYDSYTYEIMEGKLYSARRKCETKFNMEYHTSGNSLGSPTGKGKAIDHVFYSKSGITAKHFETLISPYSYSYSDHVPVLMDFVLK